MSEIVLLNTSELFYLHVPRHVRNSVIEYGRVVPSSSTKACQKLHNELTIVPYSGDCLTKKEGSNTTLAQVCTGDLFQVHILRTFKLRKLDVDVLHALKKTSFQHHRKPLPYNKKSLYTCTKLKYYTIFCFKVS